MEEITPTPAAPASPTSPALARRSFLGRSAAVGAAAVAAPLVLNACSSDSDGGGGGTGGDGYVPGSATLQFELAPEVDGVPYPEGYVGPRARDLTPFGDGTTEFTVLSQVDPDMDLTTNYYSNLLAERTGVNVSYVTVPKGEDGKTKVNAIVAGGDLPHAMMVGQGIFNLSEISIYGEQGLFIPLDKLIDENAPHILDMFESFPEMRAQYTSPNGAMYGLPSMNDCYHCKSANVRTWINSHWLEGVGASAPETLDDFSVLMDEFRAYSGKPDGSALVSASAETMPALTQFFLGSFLEMPDLWVRRSGDTVEWIHEDPAFREGVIWLQEQFRSGNLDTAMFANTSEQYQKLGDASGGPKFGMAYGYATFHFAAHTDLTDPENVARVMVPMAPMEGPGGVRTAQWDHFAYGYPNFVITPQCPDPAQLVRWADAQFELQLINSMKRGEQGVGWDWATSDQKGIDGRQAIYQVLDKGKELKNQTWREWGPLYQSVDQRHGEAVKDANPSVEPILYEAGKLYEPFATKIENGVPPLIYDMDQSAEIGEIETNLDNLYKQTIAAFGTGTKDATKDADWEEYIATAKAIGVETFVQIKQTAYDARNQ